MLTATLRRHPNLSQQKKMKQLLLLFFLLSSEVSKSQQWVEIPGTKIFFSNFIHVNMYNWQLYDYEYFKKGEQLLMVDKNVALSNQYNFFNGLYSVLEQAPQAFDSIFKNAPIVIKPTSAPHYDYALELDSNLKSIPFSSLVAIDEREEVVGHKEIIWVLTNSTIGYGEGPCYISLAFHKRKYREGKFNLKFLSARRGNCTI